MKTKASEQELLSFIMRDFQSKGNDSKDSSWESDESSENEQTQEQSSKLHTVSTEKPFQDENAFPMCQLFEKSQHISFSKFWLYDQQNEKWTDVQKPWSVYWALNSLAILNKLHLVNENNRIALTKFVLSFENKREGGFSGGSGYHSNIISSYAAVLDLCLLNQSDLCKSIDRVKFLEFLFRMKVIINTDVILKPRLPHKLKQKATLSTFKLSENGEVDIRNIYTTLVIHHLLDLPKRDELFAGCEDYIVACQTYEGGIGPNPGHEAHGGFTYCGVASLALLGKLESLDTDRLLKWLCNRQTYYEGGFSGRTNKIVDSCYSFWQGASFNIIAEYNNFKGEFLYQPDNLYKYLLLGCQGQNGGFKDKPSKQKDIYHTMYSLLGLGLSVNLIRKLGKNDDRLCEDWPVEVFSDLHPIFTIPRTSLNTLSLKSNS